jgi:hypothetical protein
MVQDPVTGTFNSNPKQPPKQAEKKAGKVSQPNMLIDLRPLDKFESKLIGEKRLSVWTPISEPADDEFDTNHGKVWSGGGMSPLSR